MFEHHGLWDLLQPFMIHDPKLVPNAEGKLFLFFPLLFLPFLNFFFNKLETCGTFNNVRASYLTSKSEVI